MRWVLLALVGCDTRSDAPPFDTVIGDPACESAAVRVGSPRYGGAPIFAADPYLTLDRTEEGSAFTRVDVDPPVDLGYDMIDIPGGTGRLVPRETFPPGARLRLDEGNGCPVWEGDVHPAGLPVDPADLHGKTWELQEYFINGIFETTDPDSEFPSKIHLPPGMTTGDWPLFLHAEVDGQNVAWSTALGALAADGLPNPCVLPMAILPTSSFDPAQPKVSVPEMPVVTLGGASVSITLLDPSLVFTASPSGASVSLVRVQARVDPKELAEVYLGEALPDEPGTDWCRYAAIDVSSDTNAPPCLPCTTTPSGFCTDRALIILDAPAVVVPWPTEASIAANPACLTGG